jgi:8-oxo-dGTP pyrophosphatase MutT (NUDIX family)
VDALVQQLRERLAARTARALNLPGVTFREAAVLVPLVAREGEPHLVFTRRPETLRQHAGQISFPGGSRDETDPTPLHTALREAEEELGIPPARVDVLGALDENPTITQFRIQPFVGVVAEDVRFVANPEEIAEIIEVPLRALLDPSIHRVERHLVLGAERDVYFFDYGPHVIWGATARIVRNLFEIAAELPALVALRGK